MFTIGHPSAKVGQSSNPTEIINLSVVLEKPTAHRHHMFNIRIWLRPAHLGRITRGPQGRKQSSFASRGSRGLGMRGARKGHVIHACSHLNPDPSPQIPMSPRGILALRQCSTTTTEGTATQFSLCQRSSTLKVLRPKCRRHHLPFCF